MENKENYIVVKSYNFETFTKTVNKAISEGYTLVGGVSIAVYLQPNHETVTKYAQALCKL